MVDQKFMVKQSTLSGENACGRQEVRKEAIVRMGRLRGSFSSAASYCDQRIDSSEWIAERLGAMFRDNPIGVLILGLCSVVALVLVWQIVTGERLSYNGPGWLIWVLAGIMFLGSLYALFAGRVRGEDQQWPSPTAGRKPLWKLIWDRIRGTTSDS